MRAKEAIRSAPAHLIKAEANGGIVTIYHSEVANAAEGEYHVRFVPRDQSGGLDLSGESLLGSFSSLEQAVAAVAAKCSVSDDNWSPQDRASW